MSFVHCALLAISFTPLMFAGFHNHFPPKAMFVYSLIPWRRCDVNSNVVRGVSRPRIRFFCVKTGRYTDILYLIFNTRIKLKHCPGLPCSLSWWNSRQKNEDYCQQDTLTPASFKLDFHEDKFFWIRKCFRTHQF